MMSRTKIRLAIAALAAVTTLSLTGCDVLLGQVPIGANSTTPSAALTPTATCNNGPYESIFSAYGAIHYSRIMADNLTLYLDMYTDEKTHDWFAETPKELSFTVNIVDTDAAEKDPFKLKRKTYMSEIIIQANSVTTDGQTEKLYDQDLDPIEATLDPEALKSKYGLLITSPKGGFLYQHNIIAPSTLANTIGFNMDFDMTISIQEELGDKKYKTRDYTVSLPVTVFSEATKNTVTSCATESTLTPVPADAD
jgi:hypothetical protein